MQFLNLAKRPACLCVCVCECYISLPQTFSQKSDTASAFEFAHLTNQWVCDVGPVDTVLQLQLVM